MAFVLTGMFSYCALQDGFTAIAALYDANVSFQRLSAEHLHVAG
jgi:hypothetical protein